MSLTQHENDENMFRMLIVSLGDNPAVAAHMIGDVANLIDQGLSQHESVILDTYSSSTCELAHKPHAYAALLLAVLARDPNKALPLLAAVGRVFDSALTDCVANPNASSLPLSTCLLAATRVRCALRFFAIACEIGAISSPSFVAFMQALVHTYVPNFTISAAAAAAADDNDFTVRADFIAAAFLGATLAGGAAGLEPLIAHVEAYATARRRDSCMSPVRVAALSCTISSNDEHLCDLASAAVSLSASAIPATWHRALSEQVPAPLDLPTWTPPSISTESEADASATSCSAFAQASTAVYFWAEAAAQQSGLAIDQGLDQGQVGANVEAFSRAYSFLAQRACSARLICRDASPNNNNNYNQVLRTLTGDAASSSDGDTLMFVEMPSLATRLMMFEMQHDIHVIGKINPARAAQLMLSMLDATFGANIVNPNAGANVVAASDASAAAPKQSLPWQIILMVENVLLALLEMPTPRGACREVYYEALLRELCRAAPRFVGRAFARIMKCIIADLNDFHPEAILRLANLLAMHLTNFQLAWPWADWSSLVAAAAPPPPPSSPQQQSYENENHEDRSRAFAMGVLERLVRLNRTAIVREALSNYPVILEAIDSIAKDKDAADSPSATLEQDSLANGAAAHAAAEAHADAQAKQILSIDADLQLHPKTTTTTTTTTTRQANPMLTEFVRVSSAPKELLQFGAILRAEYLGKPVVSAAESGSGGATFCKEVVQAAHDMLASAAPSLALSDFRQYLLLVILEHADKSLSHTLAQIEKFAPLLRKCFNSLTMPHASESDAVAAAAGAGAAAAAADAVADSVKIAARQDYLIATQMFYSSSPHPQRMLIVIEKLLRERIVHSSDYASLLLGSLKVPQSPLPHYEALRLAMHSVVHRVSVLQARLAAEAIDSNIKRVIQRNYNSACDERDKIYVSFARSLCELCKEDASDNWIILCLFNVVRAFSRNVSANAASQIAALGLLDSPTHQTHAKFVSMLTAIQ